MAIDASSPVRAHHLRAYDERYGRLAQQIGESMAAAENAAANANQAASDIRDAAASIPLDYSSMTAAVARLQNDVARNSDSIAIAGNEMVGEVTAGVYIGDNSKIGSVNNNELKITSYRVVGGSHYVLLGSFKLASPIYPIVAFSEQPLSVGLRCTVLRESEETNEDRTFSFAAPSDGYIHVARFDSSITGRAAVLHMLDTVRGRLATLESKAASIEVAQNLIKDNLDIGYDVAGSVDGTLFEGAYINTSPVISKIGNADFKVRQFRVVAGNVYRLIGKQASVSAAVYPLAAFGESELVAGGNKLGNYSTTIIPGDSANVPRDYDVEFTPQTDGYVFTASYGARPYVSVYETEVVPRIVYRLSSSTKDTVKVQTFGDSITDETWRSDKTTWATLLPDLIPQRRVQLTNSAVGGSGIGHGHSDTARYAEKDFNYVYDLMTDGTLDTSSDIVVMFVGTNNWAGGGELGSWGDSTTSTFYGAARLVCEKVTMDTDALFVVCTPCQRYNSVDQGRETNRDGEPINGRGNTLREYCDALVKTCGYYGVPVIDLYSDLGWNRLNVGRFCPDGLHPGAEGSGWIARLIAGEIKKHLGI